MKDSKNGTGPSLLDYPRPSVAVDTAVLTVAGGEVCVLLVRREEDHQHGTWALPGAFLRERVWSVASLYDTSTLVSRATGSPLGADAFIRHVKRRYLS